MDLIRRYNNEIMLNNFLERSSKYIVNIKDPEFEYFQDKIMDLVNNNCPNVIKSTNNNYPLPGCSIECNNVEKERIDGCCFDCTFIDIKDCEDIKSYCKGF